LFSPTRRIYWARSGGLNFYFLAPKPDWTAAVFLMLSSCVHNRLVSWEVAKKDVGNSEMWIPDVECWYPGAIDLESIEEVILVNIIGKEPSGLARIIIEAHRIEQEENERNE
jgi:hypothetical protein